MPYDDPVTTHGWPDFFALWSKVLFALSVLVIILWVLSVILESDADEEIAAAEVIVEEKIEPILETKTSKPAPPAQSKVSEQKAESDGYILISDIKVVHVYFAIGSDIVPLESVHDLRPVIDFLVTNKNSVAILSGYHDSSGNKEINQEISKKRAMAVRDFLVVEGVGLDRLILKKPQQSQGSGTAEEARRVEVAVATRQ